MLFDYLEGKKGIRDVLDTYKFNVPLRNQVIRKVLNTLKDGYERKQGESTGGSRVENKSDDVRFRSKLADQREYYTSLRGGDKRNRAEVDARYSIQTPEGAEETYKASLLEEAMRMEREATSGGVDLAQEIADTTGWVRLANGVIVFDGLCNKIELFKHIEQLFVSLRSCSLYRQASRLDF